MHLSLYSAGPQHATVVEYVLILALAVVLCDGKSYHYLCYLLAQISPQVQDMQEQEEWFEPAPIHFHTNSKCITLQPMS